MPNYIQTEGNDLKWVIDIETDSLDPTVIWVMCVKNIGTAETATVIGEKAVREWLDSRVAEGCWFVAHNGIKFDVPVCNRLAGSRIGVSRSIDTMVMSMVYSPSLKGGHGLEGWGERLKKPKGEFYDFNNLSDDMIKYCQQDVEITYTLYHRLTARMRAEGFTEGGMEIEHKSWNIIRKQQVNGFAFKHTEAMQLFQELRRMESDLRDELYEIWPPQLLPVKTYKKAYKKDGSESATLKSHKAAFPALVIHPDGSYTVHDWVEFDLGSPTQRLEKLMETGWEPREPTKSKKSWKVTDKGELVPSLVEFIEENKDNAEAVGAIKLAKWLTYNNRSTMLGTWLDNYNDKTGAIHGNLWYANTLRYRHSNPNTANIPAVRLDGHGKPLLREAGDFTYEARDLWTVRDRATRTLVGVDAKGIQLRVLAHYLNNPEFTKQLLEGDPHEYNRKLAGIGTRPDAKTFIYAFLLGAGDELIGKIVKGTAKDGRRTKRQFIANFPGLAELLDSLADERERTGRIKLADGTPIIVSQAHTVLGYLLQGDESRIMKLAAINVDAAVRKAGLDVLKVGDIHDEWQSDLLTEHADAYIDICHEAFKKAGEQLNYRLPIECDAKKGKSWAETH
jgi:DNA polymerase-1